MQKIIEVPEEGDIYENIANEIGRKPNDDTDALWFMSKSNVIKWTKIKNDRI